MIESKLQESSGLLDRFGSGKSLDDCLDALTELIKQRVLHAAREDERLMSGLDFLRKLASDAQVAEDRLRAVAAISRVGTVKSLSKNTGKILCSAFEQPLPSLAQLSDPDDRYYVASALSQASQAWIVKYAAVGVVEEKQAEKARQELVAVLFQKLDSLADVFGLLSTELKKFKPDTKNPGDSVAKRLERILAAIRPQSVSALIEPGSDAGKRLQDMLQSTFAESGAPETTDVAIKVTEQIAGLLHDIARTQIALVADSNLYGALDTPRRWFSPPEWRYVAEKSSNLQLLTRDIREALTLLAKQGVTDDELLEQLEKVSGSRESASKITKNIAEQHLELDMETRNWLRTVGKGSKTSTFGFLEESRELSADPVLATLMTDGNLLREALSSISEDAQMELRVLEPELAGPLDILLARCGAMLIDLDTLATKRGLAVEGYKGQVVEYSQSLHELVGGHEAGVRKVKIIQPMVIRNNVGQVGEVVRKALVEKVS